MAPPVSKTFITVIGYNKQKKLVIPLDAGFVLDYATTSPPLLLNQRCTLVLHTTHTH